MATDDTRAASGPGPSGATVRLDGGAGAHPGARPGATLIVDVEGTLRAVPLDAGTALSLGRDPACDIAIDDAGLSRHHARFRVDGGVTVEDLGSTNGTRVNGVAIAAHVPAPVAAGDDVLLGGVRVRVLGGVAGEVAGGQRRVLVPHEVFLRSVEDEVLRARLFGRSFTLVLVRVLALSAGAGVARLLPHALAALRSVDRAAAFADDVLELALVETDADAAQALAVRLGTNAAIALASAVASFPEDGTSAEALLSAALAVLGNTAQPPRRAQSQRRKVVSPADRIVASSPMSELMRTVDKVARSSIPVLLVGETGSGKEVLARQIHARSARKDAPLVAVNCGAIPTTLVESTLFGHEKGAFTGAAELHKGVFEAADGGAVFLDEVGELPPAAQTALLRVLEAKTITRVGANKERAVDVRLMAATHRDLDAMVAAGTFRQDLLYRLNAMTLAVPPLRERRDEIAGLAQAFVDEAAARHRRTVEGFTEDAAELLVRYPWPGNIRELKNAVERGVVIAGADRIDVDDLPDAVRASGERSGLIGGSGGASLGEQLEKIEAQLILEALEKNQQNVGETARALQMPKRTLQHRMKLLGISRKVGYAR